MQCPKCSTTVQISDRFCEECGTPLAAENAMPKSTTGCEKCGAGVEEIDAEGFCSNCGFRCEARNNDYFEVILNSNLAGVSDRGLRHHRNEDYLACAQVEGKNAHILVVCDGVSSSQSSDLAAKAAAKATCRALTTAVENGVKSVEAMKEAVTAALASVCAIPYGDSADVDSPSTTLVAAIIKDHIATIGWLGDSRAYWISPDGSRQLTRDDSWMNEIVASGEMTEVEASKSDKAHAITRWLGVDAINDAEPSIVQFDIPGSGHLLLCSDGLWNYAPESSQIAELVQQTSDTDAVTISRQLVEFARRCGGRDNITVAILSLKS